VLPIEAFFADRDAMPVGRILLAAWRAALGAAQERASAGEDPVARAERRGTDRDGRIGRHPRERSDPDGGPADSRTPYGRGVAEIYRSRDGRYTIERVTDRYLIYDEAGADPTEMVWSCRTIGEVYQWIEAHGLSLADFEETG
jgi:hypothetical protein